MALRLLLKTSLKMRMTMLVVLLVLGATIIVTSVALSLAEQDMKTVIGDQQFARLRGSASMLDQQLGARQSMLRSLAEDLPPAARAAPEALQRFIAQRQNLLREFSNIGAFDMQGKMVASTRDNAGVAAAAGSFSQRPYFIDTVRQRQGVISAPLRSAVLGNPVVVFTQPVFDADNRMLYIIAASVDLGSATLFDEVAASDPGTTGFMYIMSTKGILIKHPTRARLLENIYAKPGVNPATARALAGFEGWIEAPNEEGSQEIYAYKRLTRTDWIVASRFPSDEAFAPIRQLRLRVLFASALLAALAGIIGWLATRRALAPLERLRQQAMLVREGRTDIRVLQLERQDEIGELSGAIYALMAQSEAAQTRIVASESLIRSILERAPDAFVSCDSNGAILEWNARAEETFGWSRAEALGRDIAALIIPHAMRAAHHAGMAVFARTGDGPIINTRTRVQACHRDGSIIPIELSVGSLVHGDAYIATAFLHDVSERITFENAIAASEKRARMIADAMPALIAYIDRDLVYRFSNARHQAMLGIDPATMIGRHLGDVLSPDTFALLSAPLVQALGGASVQTELAPDGPAGARHFVAHFIPDFDANGSVAGCYVMVLDISERKIAELRQAASERKAEAANQAKTDFVANMSHEIRTPLNAVLGITHLLGKTSLLPEQRHYLDMVRASGTALLTILNDVLDFSKIEAGRMELSSTTFQLSDVLDAIATMMTVNAGEKNLALSIGVQAVVPPTLTGDSLRLQQVLINLVGNAVKFTKDGAVRLVVEQAAREGAQLRLRFSVHDTGIGMSAEEQGHLFTAFSQADASTTRRFGGTGLGLAICRRLTDLMGGTLELHSTPGQGSSFVLELPLLAAPAPAPARPSPFQRLLVVDPGADSRDYVCWMAASWGWAADSAASMPQALAAIAKCSSPYSAILFDWEMLAIAPQAAVKKLVSANGASPTRVLVFMSTRARGQYVQQTELLENSVTMLKPGNAAGILEALAGAAQPAALAEPAPPLRGARILLVEDNPLNQFVARGVLEQAGAEVESADDGVAALALLQQAPERFQLILMDVQMPGMDGYAATRAIRNELRLHTPIIAMSAGVLSFEREQCVDAGMDDFVAKPLDVERMIECLVRHLPQPARAPSPGAKFDLSKLLRNLKPAQHALLGNLVRRVAQQIPADLATIRQACSGGSPRAAAPVLHGLRGSVGSFGAHDFVAAALALEALIASGEQAGLAHALERVERELVQTREAALAWLAANSDLAQAASAATPAAEKLAQFSQLLGERNIDACELLEELRAHFTSAHGEAFMAAMDQHMSGLEFEAALRLLQPKTAPT